MIDLLRNPPSWIIAIIVAVLTAHALDKLIAVVTRHRRQNVVPIIEILIVMVLSVLAIHAYYEGALAGSGHREWYDQPFALVIALVLFGLGSIALYLASRVPPSPRKSGKK